MHLTQEIAEIAVKNAVQWLRLGVETIGASVVAVGIVMALLQFVKAALSSHTVNFNLMRLSLARYLALALEFQLGADILSTAIAPTRNEIQNLAAIAVIRTGLNYFLSREMKEEQAREEDSQKGGEVARRLDSSAPEAITHPD